jgi:universal stress protein A
MGMYNKILVLTDLSAEASLIIQRAKLVADGQSERLYLLHVVEYLPLEPMGEAVLPPVQMEAELLTRAKTQMAQLGSEWGIPAQQQIVTVGSTKAETQQTAQRLAVDLIVVGNHERHGLKALVNFTEDAVLHTAPCDVLAVHLPDKVRKK